MKNATAAIIKQHLSNEARAFFEKANDGWLVATNDCLEIIQADGSATTYVIFTGPWTRNEMCRDCGAFYELSLYGKLYQISKDSLTIAQAAH